MFKVCNMQSNYVHTNYLYQLHYNNCSAIKIYMNYYNNNLHQSRTYGNRRYIRKKKKKNNAGKVNDLTI